MRKMGEGSVTTNAATGVVQPLEAERGKEEIPPRICSSWKLDFIYLTVPGLSCGTWDSPAGKPRGKATDPLIHAKGSVTLLLQLGRKAHVHALTRDED